MRKRLWRRKSSAVIAGVLCAVLGAGALLPGKLAYTQADEGTVHYDLSKEAFSGEESELLLTNPDRGLRMEAYLNVGTGMSEFEYEDMDGIEQLRQQVERYGSDSPQLAQVYFYLTEYKDKDLDEAAFEKMNEYFDVLEEYNVKAVLRFAYITEQGGIELDQEPATEQAVRHIYQLEDFIKEHEDQIHVFQMGFIGAWGEWDGAARGRMNEKEIIKTVLDVVPDDMQIQVRYMDIKNSNKDIIGDEDWARVGYHDDYLIGNLHVWNSPGTTDRNADTYKQMTEESEDLLIDGEMIWGTANAGAQSQIGGTVIDSIKMAKRLCEHHFTSLSMTHNYKEPKKNDAGEMEAGEWSMTHWQHEYINQKTLEQNGLPYAPGWFKDTDGNNIPRTMFEYIRDYLGYYLMLESAQADVAGDEVKVELTLNNYGFAAPLALAKVELVLLDTEGNEVEQAAVCSPDKLDPLAPQTVSVTLTKPSEDRIYRLALSIRADDGTSVRLANDMENWNGYQVLGDL